MSKQVRKNFAGWTNKEVAKVVGWLVKTLAMFTPAAMLGSTAPFPDPGEVIVELRTANLLTRWEPLKNR